MTKLSSAPEWRATVVIASYAAVLQQARNGAFGRCHEVTVASRFHLDRPPTSSCHSLELIPVRGRVAFTDPKLSRYCCGDTPRRRRNTSRICCPSRNPHSAAMVLSGLLSRSNRLRAASMRARSTNSAGVILASRENTRAKLRGLIRATRASVCTPRSPSRHARTCCCTRAIGESWSMNGIRCGLNCD